MVERLTLDTYVIDSLMPDLVGHDRRASAFIVFLYLWRRTRGGARAVVVSHQQVADATGLVRRSVQHAFSALLRRRLITTTRASKTSASSVRLSLDWRE